jgi:phage gp46-like protein
MADLSFLFDQQKRHSDIRIVGGDFLLCDSPQIDVAEIITDTLTLELEVTNTDVVDGKYFATVKSNGRYQYFSPSNNNFWWDTGIWNLQNNNNGDEWQVISNDLNPPKTGWSASVMEEPPPILLWSFPSSTKETVFNSSSLQVAVELSLFTDRRATLDEIRTFQGGMKGRQSRRGLWANSFKKHTQGSGLWLLQREKKTNSTLSRAKKACIESLQWLIDDGVVRSITVEVEFVGDSIIILVSVVKPDGQDGTFKFQSSWNALEVI